MRERSDLPNLPRGSQSLDQRRGSRTRRRKTSTRNSRAVASRTGVRSGWRVSRRSRPASRARADVADQRGRPCARRSPPAAPALRRRRAVAAAAGGCGRSSGANGSVIRPLAAAAGTLPADSVAANSSAPVSIVGVEARLVAAGRGLGQRQRARRRRRRAPGADRRSPARCRRGPTMKRSSAPTASTVRRTRSPDARAADREVGGRAPPHGRARHLRPQLLVRAASATRPPPSARRDRWSRPPPGRGRAASARAAARRRRSPGSARPAGAAASRRSRPARGADSSGTPPAPRRAWRRARAVGRSTIDRSPSSDVSREKMRGMLAGSRV